MNVGVSERREMVDKGTTGVSIKRQCNLLGINRSGFYYQAIPESELNLLAMRLMDAYFMDHPHTGVESMWGYLVKSEGLAVNQKRIRRLLRLMGLMALYPKKKLSTPGGEGHNYYPYLLRGLKIERVDQVWETDITYIPMKKGFMYMMAVIDVKSRYVLQWDISNTMDAVWCTEVLKETIRQHGVPEIFNTDQGSQFTSEVFLDVLRGHDGLKISMDGKGRALDNIFIERFWRSLKYEHVYLCPAANGRELFRGIRDYMKFYNQERRHQSIGFQTPQESYAQKPDGN
jgi:putative transposase